jgi:asparagine synthase (glutamine-hydrolysing)
VRDKRDRFLYADLCAYLPEDVLFKVDRMSMVHSLEVRVPLLDQHLLSWVLRLPFDLRYRRARGKYLLRKVAARYLPPSILRPRKQGFGIPIGRWLRGELMQPVREMFLSERFQRRGIIRPQAALELLKMHSGRRYELGHRLWSLVIFEAWARIWMDGQSPEQCILT